MNSCLRLHSRFGTLGSNKSVNSDVIARRSFVAPRNGAGYLHRYAVAGLAERIRKLEAFALWRKPVCINYAELAEADHWTLHTTNLERVLSLLEEAEAHAMKLRALAEVEARRQRSDA